MFHLCLALITCASLACGLPALGEQDDVALPAELLIGAGNAAVQTEGAWNEDGKGESVIDHIFHSGKLEAQGYQGAHLHDGGADSYHRYKEDVAMAAKLKLQMYRFSISWARLLPEGDATRPNPKGVQFYHNLIDEIIAYNMTPLVTLHHFDHPQILEDEFKGWLNKKMVKKFREYATFVFKEYGHKVHMWTSANEPNVYCSYFLRLMGIAEMLQPDEVADIYPCLHHFVLAHGEAHDALKQSGHEGMIGFTVTSFLSRPNSTRPEDAYASETLNQLSTGMLLHPLVFGDYSPVVKEQAKEKLPVFTEEEKAMVKNSTDYIGLNIYYGFMASYRDPTTPTIYEMPLLRRLDVGKFINVAYRDPEGRSIASYPFDTIAPDAIRSSVAWTWFQYKKPIIVTENGYGTENMQGVEDRMRAVYHSRFLRSLVSAVKDFGIRVIGYCAWSLVDAFEWSQGYDRSFSLVHVDIKGGSYNRTLKESSSFWIELADRRTVPVVDVPSSSTSTSISCLLLVVLASASTLT